MKPVTIIGGGLAGLALGLDLRRRDVPVTISEAGTYPRHRVCGEFISGRGAELIEQLITLPVLRARTAAFFVGARSTRRHELPAPALCISRFALDAALAEQFRSCGGVLRERERVVPPKETVGVVFACGRRPQPVENGWRWIGVKAHARGVSLDADLEMHLSTSGYVGLCRLPAGEVNVCGLFRRRVENPQRGHSIDWLRGEPGSVLFDRLEPARFDEDSLCAVAGLSLAPQPIDPRVCRIGDALTMIPPITGNGMSMALESAQLAVQPLLRFARHEASWSDSTEEIARRLRQTFSRRLRWAAWLHQMIFSPAGAAALPLLLRATPVWRASFAATR